MNLTERVRAIWRVPESLREMRNYTMATKEEFVARLDAASTELAGDLADLKQKIADAVAQGQGVDQAWADALEGPIARLEAMGRDAENPDPEGDVQSEAPAPVEADVNSGDATQ